MHAFTIMLQRGWHRCFRLFGESGSPGRGNPYVNMSVVQGEDVESDDECGYETPEDKDENVVDEKEDNSIAPYVKGQGTVVAGEESETDEEDTGSDRETTEPPRSLSKNVAKDHEVISPGDSERPLVSTGKSYVYNRFVLAISRLNVHWSHFAIYSLL